MVATQCLSPYALLVNIANKAAGIKATTTSSQIYGNQPRNVFTAALALKASIKYTTVITLVALAVSPEKASSRVVVLYELKRGTSVDNPDVIVIALVSSL